MIDETTVRGLRALCAGWLATDPDIEAVVAALSEGDDPPEDYPGDFADATEDRGRAEALREAAHDVLALLGPEAPPTLLVELHPDGGGRLDCPACDAPDIVELSPCEGIHVLHLGVEKGTPVIDAAWSTHTDMHEGYPYCRSCMTELAWPHPVPTVNYS